MSQAYSAGFARIYNQRWNAFALRAGPLIRQFYEAQPGLPDERRLLDLCCGSGRLARIFLDAGYDVTGIDLSESMLAHARQNNLPYLTAGQARFLQADAADFRLERGVGLVISTFDALNHLPDFASLRRCFACVRQALLPGGWFIFDLNTMRGLKEQWNGISVSNTPELALINHAIWVEETRRGYTAITGFARLENGLYERFEETVFNSAFEMARVCQALQEEGFANVYTARLEELAQPVVDPEAEARVFFIARLDPASPA